MRIDNSLEEPHECQLKKRFREASQCRKSTRDNHEIGLVTTGRSERLDMSCPETFPKNPAADPIAPVTRGTNSPFDQGSCAVILAEQMAGFVVGVESGAGEAAVPPSVRRLPLAFRVRPDSSNPWFGNGCSDRIASCVAGRSACSASSGERRL
jgi:hypothetical protein